MYQKESTHHTWAVSTHPSRAASGAWSEAGIYVLCKIQIWNLLAQPKQPLLFLWENNDERIGNGWLFFRTETRFCPATTLGPRKTILFRPQLFVYCSAPGSNSRVPEALLLLKLNQNLFQKKKKKNQPNCFCLFELGLDTVTKMASPSSTGAAVPRSPPQGGDAILRPRETQRPDTWGTPWDGQFCAGKS